MAASLGPQIHATSLIAFCARPASRKYKVDKCVRENGNSNCSSRLWRINALSCTASGAARPRVGSTALVACDGVQEVREEACEGMYPFPMAVLVSDARDAQWRRRYHAALALCITGRPGSIPGSAGCPPALFSSVYTCYSAHRAAVAVHEQQHNVSALKICLLCSWLAQRPGGRGLRTARSARRGARRPGAPLTTSSPRSRRGTIPTAPAASSARPSCTRRPCTATAAPTPRVRARVHRLLRLYVLSVSRKPSAPTHRGVAILQLLLLDGYTGCSARWQPARTKEIQISWQYGGRQRVMAWLPGLLCACTEHRRRPMVEVHLHCTRCTLERHGHRFMADLMLLVWP